MSEKPQPLDLDFKTILEIIRNPNAGDYTKAYAIENYIKQCIKSACEFYSRYKDNPELLIQEHPEYENTLTRFLKDLPFAVPFNEKMFNPLYFDYKKYNKWLFNLAFKSVFEEKENE